MTMTTTTDQSPEDPLKLFSVRLPQSLIKKVKTKAFMEETSVQALAEQAFEDLLNKVSNKEAETNTQAGAHVPAHVDPTSGESE